METHPRPFITWRTTRAAAVVATLAILASVSIADGSDGPGGHEVELDRLRGQLTAVIAERDALLEAAEARAEQHQRSSTAQQMIIDIIAEPLAFGSEDEALDLLDDLAVPGATMDDVALGEAPWRSAWRGTLFDAQADIHTWAKWIADDGSIGGSLWTWAGTAASGAPFTLPGVDVSTYDESGLTTSVVVYWPYEDAEVECIFGRGNEACALDGS